MRMLSVLAFAVAILLTAPQAFAHAEPTRAIPQAGANLAQPPQKVQIWFSAGIEPGFSTLIVKNAAGQPVSEGKGHVDTKDRQLLESTLRARLPTGDYTVEWSVAARDGHRTEGRYRFTVQ